jgi:hypothetical protein
VLADMLRGSEGRCGWNTTTRGYPDVVKPFIHR